MKIKPVPGTLDSQLNTIFIDVFEKHPKYKQPCRRYSGGAVLFASSPASPLLWDNALTL